jgi:hypothetical protein
LSRRGQSTAGLKVPSQDDLWANASEPGASPLALTASPPRLSTPCPQRTADLGFSLHYRHVTLVRDDGEHVVSFELLHTAQEGQLDEEGNAHYLAPEPLHQPRRRCG